jgi:glycosyltransferase involved in cell wall biosynthesis
MHVIPSATRRGGQIFAADLIGALNQAAVVQHTAILSPAEPGDVEYDAPTMRITGYGWDVPGLRLDIGTVRRLRSLFADWRPDVVQGHGGDSLKYTVLAASGRGRTPVVHRAIGMTPPWIKHGPRRTVYGRLIRRTARVVAVAEAVRREILHLFGLPPGRVITIPNAVDPGRMDPSQGREATRRALGIEADAPVVLSVAALTWEKDPLGHIDVTEGALRDIPGAHHLFVGDGPLRGELERAIHGRGLNGQVRLLGVRADTADIFAASDVLLFASRSDGMEGMPGIIIEAGMAGVPAVAYSVAGVAELIRDGATGFLAAPGDAGALAHRVSELLSDPRSRRRMGEAARERCGTHFDIRAVAPRYLETYEACVAGSRRLT